VVIEPGSFGGGGKLWQIRAAARSRQERERFPREFRQKLFRIEPLFPFQKLDQPGRPKRPFQASGKRNDFFDGKAAKKSLERRPPVVALNVLPGFFKQLPVLDAARANRLASPAAQAKIDVSRSRLDEGQPAVLKRAHQIDAAPRRVIFVAGLQISGTGGKAESTVNARQRLLLIEKMGRWSVDWIGISDLHRRSPEI